MQLKSNVAQEAKRSQLDGRVLESNGPFSGDSDAEYSDKDSRKIKNSEILGSVPTRSAVLQACTLTSGLMVALGIIIRQVGFVMLYSSLKIF